MAAPAQTAKMNVIGRSGSLLLVITATALWSTSGIFITYLIRGSNLTPVTLAFWRDLGTFLCLLVGLALFQPALLRVRRRDLPWLAAMGALSIGLFHFAWNVSIMVNGAALSVVFQSNAPILVTLVAWFLWQEPLTGRKLAAIALALAGTVLIAGLFQGEGAGAGMIEITARGMLLGVGLALAYSTMSLFGKKLVGTYSAWTVLLYIFGFGALTLLPLQIGSSFPRPLVAETLLPFAGLVLLTTIGGFGLYTLGLRGLQASIATITATTEIPFAAFLAYLLLDERLTVAQIVGSLLVAVGVILVSWKRRNGLSRKQ